PGGAHPRYFCSLRELRAARGRRRRWGKFPGRAPQTGLPLLSPRRVGREPATPTAAAAITPPPGRQPPLKRHHLRSPLVIELLYTLTRTLGVALLVVDRGNPSIYRH
ncbi:unnamed protein product, partial [Sphacelaria rigidula]